MSLQTEIIPFSLRSGTGTQTVNHVVQTSVLAKAYIFVCADNSGTNSEIYSLGFDDGTTHLANGIGIADSFGICTARGFSTTKSLVTEQAQAFFGGAARMLSGYVSAMNVGSFEITLTINNTPGANWYAIMIGGDGVECAVGIYDRTLGSGDVTVGFDVAAVLHVGVPDAGVDGEIAGASHACGFATQCPNVSDQVGWGIECSTGSRGASYQIADILQANITSGAVGPDDEITVSAWIANGFSLSIVGLAGWNVGYLAIGGDAVSANLVQITQPTSTGVQNVAITATDPVLALFGSTCKVASGSPSVNTNLMFGAYDGTTTMSQWWGHIDNSSSRDRLSSTTKAINLATATGVSTSTVNADASCTLASTNIALNWTTADSTQREVWALVLAQNLTGGTNVCGANPQSSITVIKQCTPIAGGTTDFPFSSASLSPTSFTLQDGESQLFSSVTPGTYNITEAAPSGWTVSYASSNGSPHNALTVASQEAVTLTVTNTFASTTAELLRLRRFALPWDGNKQIFIPRIEIIAQMGVGNSDDPDPVMYLRLSPDGGSTWGPFRQMPLGADGDTMVRAYLTRFPQMRNPVAELVCGAPVFVAWIACELPQGFTVGSS